MLRFHHIKLISTPPINPIVIPWVAIASAADFLARVCEPEGTTMGFYPLQEHWIVNSLFEGCAKEGRICAF